MGLSCALFVIISNYVGNIDTEHEARLSVNHGQFELQLDYSSEYDERYPENNLDTILTDNPLNDSLIEEIKKHSGSDRCHDERDCLCKSERNKISGCCCE